MRDGVSFNDHKTLKPIIKASEFLSLDDLNAYLKLPGDLPITKIKFEYKKFEIIAPSYCEMPDLDSLETRSNIVHLHKKERYLLKENREEKEQIKDQEESTRFL